MGSLETMKYWPRRIESPEDVPAAFEREYADSARESIDALYAPALGSLFSAQKEHLLILDKTTLVIHTAQGDWKRSSSFPLREIELLEWGSVLLHSWVKIWAGGGSVTIPFNAVREDLFTPLIAGMRRASWLAEDEHSVEADHAPRDSNAARMSASTAASPNDEVVKLEYLKTRAIKFVNYGCQCLVPGERIVSTLFQEPFRVRVMLSRRFIPLTWYASPHLFILTDKELILLQEKRELAFTKSYAYRYGCVHTFLANSRIAEVGVDEYDSFRELLVRTTAGQTIRSRFADDNPEFPDFLQALGNTGHKKGVSRARPRERSLRRRSTTC